MKFRPLIGVAIAASLALAACGGSDNASDTTMPTTAEGIDLAAAGCPSTVIIQTDWFPEAEHGNLYNLIGPGYTISKEMQSVTGDLVSGGKTTGVKVQVRTGGPAIDGLRPTGEMYQDPEVLLGFTGTDEQVRNSTTFPTIAVVAPFNINPQIIMWDPINHPEVKTIADLKEPGVRVRYFQDADYMKYLIQSGQLDAKQTDDTYDGSPSGFIASGGKDAQQGFGTAEPYAYKNLYKEWMKDVAFQYVHDAGWTAYQQSLGVTPANLEKYDSCLKVLVPVLQQATVDYITSPDAANAIIIDAVNTYADFWTYTAGQGDAAVDQMQADKLVANSPDGTLGSFDIERVTKFIETAIPVYSATGTKVKEGLTPADIVTNKYIDPSINLG
jgi:hypothetical protein